MIHAAVAVGGHYPREHNGLVSGKMKLFVLLKPNTIGHYLPPDKPVSDWDVAERTEAVEHQYRPQVMFTHLPGVNTVGHEFRLGSPNRLQRLQEPMRWWAAIGRSGGLDAH
jgi:hypothetical protein